MDVTKAITYLKSCYDPEIGLCYEAPHVQPNWFWIWIDNALAVQALLEYDQTFANKLFKNIMKYDSNFYTVNRHKRIEVLWGETDIMFPFQIPKKYVAYNAGKLVKNEVCDSGNDFIPGWWTFADLLVYTILYYVNQGGFWNHMRANYYYFLLNRMWDGYGFRDSVVEKHGCYATYKLGLWLTLQKRLNRHDLVKDTQCSNFINQLQQSDGGIKTDYVRTGENTVEPLPGCDTNTETTAFCLLGQ